MKKVTKPVFTPSARHKWTLPAGTLLAMLFVATARAEQADPFLTRPLTAATAAGSLQHSASPTPCAVDHDAVAPLSLAEIVERALCHNPQTREAWANARFQAAQVGVGQSAYLPSINLGGTGTRNWTDGGSAANAYKQSSASLSLAYVLYDFGARAAALENAKQILFAANATQDAAIQSVFLAALQAYYRLFAAEAAVASAREAEKSAQESFNAAAARHGVGAATPADRLQAQTALSQAVLNRIRAEGDVRNAQGLLANSMGMDAHLLPAIAPPAATMPDTRFERDVGALIAEARGLRPDLAAAEAQVKAAKAGAEAARAAGMPTISLAAGLSHSDSSNADPFRASSLGVAVNFPLFTGYGNTYRVRAAQEQIDARLAQRERISQQVALEVWAAYQGIVTETQAVKSSADLVDSATQSERVALGRYKAGVGNFLDLLTAQSALASARMQHIQALYNWHLARAGLAQAMGRLDFSAIETPVAQQTTP